MSCGIVHMFLSSRTGQIDQHVGCPGRRQTVREGAPETFGMLHIPHLSIKGLRVGTCTSSLNCNAQILCISLYVNYIMSRNCALFKKAFIQSKRRQKRRKTKRSRAKSGQYKRKTQRGCLQEHKSPLLTTVQLT